ncbi:MAG: hypothetical protein KDE27_26225 [Planctomycetes bacterium]|nr:hypothetical protein [Planctomycetota bacterium]
MSWRERRRRFDQRIATSWPALHVTQTHWIVAVTLPLYVIVLGAALVVARPQDVPDTDAMTRITLVLCGLASVGWLIGRGMSFQLLPIGVGFARARWIWLDAISLVCINGLAWTVPYATDSVLSWRSGAAAVQQDRDALFPTAPHSSWHDTEASVGNFFLGTVAPQLEGFAELRLSEAMRRDYQMFRANYRREVMDGPDTEFKRAFTSLDHRSVTRSPNDEAWPAPDPATCGRLERYCPSSRLYPNGDRSHISVEAIESAAENIRQLSRIHFDGTRTDLDFQVTLSYFGCALGLVLAVGALPAVGISGLLAALGWLVGTFAVFAIVMIGVRNEQTAMKWTLGALYAASLLAGACGLLPRRKRLWARAMLAACLIGIALVPALLSEFLHFVGTEADGPVQRAFAKTWSWAAMIALVAACPLVQYVLNRMQASPE